MDAQISTTRKKQPKGKRGAQAKKHTVAVVVVLVAAPSARAKKQKGGRSEGLASDPWQAFASRKKMNQRNLKKSAVSRDVVFDGNEFFPNRNDEMVSRLANSRFVAANGE